VVGSSTRVILSHTSFRVPRRATSATGEDLMTKLSMHVYVEIDEVAATSLVSTGQLPDPGQVEDAVVDASAFERGR